MIAAAAKRYQNFINFVIMIDMPSTIAPELANSIGIWDQNRLQQLDKYCLRSNVCKIDFDDSRCSEAVPKQYQIFNDG